MPVASHVRRPDCGSVCRTRTKKEDGTTILSQKEKKCKANKTQNWDKDAVLLHVCAQTLWCGEIRPVS